MRAVRRIATIILCVVLCAQSLIVCCFAGNFADVYNVKVKTVRVDDLIRAQSNSELELLLFPHGVHLPTRYLDFVSFMEYEGSVQVLGSTARFLEEQYPSEDGYTLAEIYAAQLYVSCLLAERRKASGELLRVDEEELLALNDVIKATTGECSIVVDSLDTFRGYLVQNQEMLRWPVENSASTLDYCSQYITALEQDESGLWLTLGFDRDVERFVRYNSTVEERTFVAEYLSGRAEYMERLGLKLVKFSEDTVDNSRYADDWSGWVASTSSFTHFAEGVDGDAWAIVAGGIVGDGDDQMQAGDEPTDSDMSAVAESATPIEEQYDKQQTEPSAGLGESDNSVPDVLETGFGNAASVVPSGRQHGWEDVMVVMCIIIVAFAIVALCVVDFIRKRNDPTRKYKRW